MTREEIDALIDERVEERLAGLLPLVQQSSALANEIICSMPPLLERVVALETFYANEVRPALAQAIEESKAQRAGDDPYGLFSGK